MENQSVLGDIIANNNVAASGDTVSVNYIGKLTSGVLFDTSIKEEAQKAGLKCAYVSNGNATSEVLCGWLWHRFAPRLPGLAAITVHETCTARCTYRGE